MKKFLMILLALVITLSVLTACTVPTPETDSPTGDVPGGETPDVPGGETPDAPGGETPDAPGGETPDTPGGETPDTPDEYKNTSFTAEEAEIFQKHVGETIPYLPNDLYTFVGYTTDTDFEHGIRFTTFGNTLDEFYAYTDALAGYFCTSTVVDDDGVTWYTYEKGKIVIVTAYLGDGDTSEVRFEIKSDLSVGMGYTKTAFTAEEIALFESYMGKAIPFAPTNEYYVQDFIYDYDTIGYYTVGNTLGDFNSYRAGLTDYSFSAKYDDELGNTWYIYKSATMALELSYCTYEEGDDAEYMIYVYVYPSPYTDFSQNEKDLFNEYFGSVIPFRPCEEFYVEDMMEENGVVEVIFLVDDVSEFSGYRRQFTDYEFVETYYDDYGDTCYVYTNGTVGVDMSCFYYDGYDSYVIDVYVYIYDNSTDTPDVPGTDTPSDEVCTDFTAEEKALLNGYFGSTVPFMETTIYGLDDYMATEDACVNFYFIVDSESAINDYIKLLSGFIFVESYDDVDFGTCHVYRKGKMEIDVSCYYEDYVGSYVIDILIYLADSDGTDIPGGSGSDTPSVGVIPDFNDDEKQIFIEHFGFVIPFVDGSAYFVEDYMETDGYVSYYVWDATAQDFAEYRASYVGYTFIESYVDGDITWYVYRKGDVEVEMAYYYYDDGEGIEGDLIDVYVYFAEDVEDDPIPPSGGGDDPVTPDADGVITNEGKGLPTDDGDGVYDVNFKDAEFVKDVTEQGYYLDGCPTTGSVAVLVIPVQFSDIMADDKGYSLDDLDAAFNGDSGSTDYFSVWEYYYLSSYGQLDLEFTVLDEWYTAKENSAYYLKQTMEYFGDDVIIGDQLVMNEALAYLDSIGMDLSKYDSDENGYIDAVILINTFDINENVDMQWAYRYWNIYTDQNDEYYEYDGVCANDYLWASFAFLYEDDMGGFTDKNAINTYTYIHEFGHILGADDYYDVTYESTVMDGHDIMDGMIGDHNAFTKFNFGWITSSRLVTGNNVTLKLEAFSKNGDTIIIANNWDPTLGAYQEYYVVVYYTNDELNGGENGYFERDGIVVYHVNAVLYSEEEGGEIYYDIYNNNSTPSNDGYGTEDNLIEFVKNGADYVYTVGDTLPVTYDDFGNKLVYTFTVDAITDGEATITVKLAE